MNKDALYKKVISYFEQKMPVAETELHYRNPYELIVSVILSAQCTDKRVNIITKELFKKFPTVQDLAKSEPGDVYHYIRSCSYPNNKARHLVGMAQLLVNNYNGKVPDNLADLQELPGVGRKTANVILSVAFKVPAMAVDTHVFRVAERIGLITGANTPLKAEMQLVKHIPEELLHKAHHWLILHGRYICTAKKPDCIKCGLTEICKYYNSELKVRAVNKSRK